MTLPGSRKLNFEIQKTRCVHKRNQNKCLRHKNNESIESKRIKQKALINMKECK